MFTKVKEYVSAFWFPAVVIVGLMIFMYKYEEYNVRRQHIICPSFLSIARYSRDTLLVMRNEPLCNAYMLNNLG